MPTASRARGFQWAARQSTLAANSGTNNLHGGVKGFDRVVWKAAISGDSLILTYRSADGEEGFPGNLDVTVKYTVSGGDLRIDYSAATDKDTIINLTNHAYFNLAGEGQGDVLGNEVTIFADRYLPVDDRLIPIGERRAVAGTAFDFRSAHTVGERAEGKYDHNFILKGGPALHPAARVHEPLSGRVMDVLSTEPGVQFYTAPRLNITAGKGGKTYGTFGALCLETQHFPDSPNHSDFPTTTLRPGKRFSSATVYRFSAR